MTRFARWCIVAGLVLAVVAVPVVLRALPAQDAQVDAATLLGRVQESRGQPYAGYVETRGSLDLPVADRFTDVGALLGEQTRLRVWWRSVDEWRVDKLLVSGETDLVHGAPLTTEWSYEDAEAQRSIDPPIRLPRTADLVPPDVGARLLRDATAGEVTRLEARTVAGRDALGLRLVPSSARSSIDRVDLWADRETGVPLRIEVYGGTGSVAAFTSEFRDFSPETPSADRTTFTAPPGADVSFDDVLDIADAANQFAPFVPPDSIAGLPRSTGSAGAVGIYGAGVTQLLAIPVRGREGAPLREQLDGTLGREIVAEGTVLTVGPLGVMLTGTGDDGGWLLAGTVTTATLREAARDLLTGTVEVVDRDDR